MKTKSLTKLDIIERLIKECPTLPSRGYQVVHGTVRNWICNNYDHLIEFNAIDSTQHKVTFIKNTLDVPQVQKNEEKIKMINRQEAAENKRNIEIEYVVKSNKAGKYMLFNIYLNLN